MSLPSGPKIFVSVSTSNFSAAPTSASAACCGVSNFSTEEPALMVAETVLGTASCAVANRPDADTIAQATRRPIARDRVPFWDTDLMCVLRQVFVFCDSAAVYLRRPPPPRKPPRSEEHTSELQSPY